MQRTNPTYVSSCPRTTVHGAPRRAVGNVPAVPSASTSQLPHRPSRSGTTMFLYSRVLNHEMPFVMPEDARTASAAAAPPLPARRSGARQRAVSAQQRNAMAMTEVITCRGLDPWSRRDVPLASKGV